MLLDGERRRLHRTVPHCPASVHSTGTHSHIRVYRRIRVHALEQDGYVLHIGAVHHHHNCLSTIWAYDETAGEICHNQMRG